MQTGLARLYDHEQKEKWHEKKGTEQNEYKIIASLIPVALLFMGLVIGASTVSPLLL
jgi:hypothetical protein